MNDRRRRLGQQKTTTTTYDQHTINDHGNKHEDNNTDWRHYNDTQTEMNRHECEERLISASSWIEINKLSRKLRIIDDRREKKKKNFSTQLDNWTMEWPLQFQHISRRHGMRSVCMCVRACVLFSRAAIFSWIINFFSFIIIIYSSLKPNYILCKVIKIIVIVWLLALIIWVQPSAVMSFGLYHSICYDCGCCCCYSDDRYRCCCYLLFLSLARSIIYLSRLFGHCQRESENITIRQYRYTAQLIAIIYIVNFHFCWYSLFLSG